MIQPLKRAALRFRAARPLASTSRTTHYYKKVVGQLIGTCKKLMEAAKKKKSYKYYNLSHIHDYYERRYATEGSFFITQNRC